MRSAVLISCGSKKLDHPARADELYVSPLFRLHLAYAQRLGGRIFILSAKHGLVRQAHVLEPYDETLKDKNRIECLRWGARVSEKLLEGAWDEVTILAGREYYRYLDLPTWNHISIPFKGLTIGKRIQALQRALSV